MYVSEHKHFLNFGVRLLLIFFSLGDRIQINSVPKQKV
jgi:hypothetical protein